MIQVAPLSSLHLGCSCDEISERARRALLLRRCANRGWERKEKEKKKRSEILKSNTVRFLEESLFLIDSANESFCETRNEATLPQERAGDGSVLSLSLTPLSLCRLSQKHIF